MSTPLTDTTTDRPSSSEATLKVVEASRRIAANSSFQVADHANIKEFLLHHWNIAVGKDPLSTMDTTAPASVSVEEEAKDPWFERIYQYHTEPTRYYHTAVHLKEMLEYVEALQLMIPLLLEKENEVLSTTSNPNDDTPSANFVVARILRLATFFHDSIYDPRGSQNEVKSAQLFQQFWDEKMCKDDTTTIDSNSITININTIISQTVRLLILATEQHQVLPFSIANANASNNNNHQQQEKESALSSSIIAIGSDLQKLFLDIDMAVLGKETTSYLAYAALIRNEYDHVPRTVYCETRAQILESFAGRRSRIYVSDVFYEILEIRAKNNLGTEIEMLQRGWIPGEEAPLPPAEPQ